MVKGDALKRLSQGNRDTSAYSHNESTPATAHICYCICVLCLSFHIMF